MSQITPDELGVEVDVLAMAKKIMNGHAEFEKKNERPQHKNDSSGVVYTDEDYYKALNGGRDQSGFISVNTENWLRSQFGDLPVSGVKKPESEYNGSGKGCLLPLVVIISIFFAVGAVIARTIP